MTSKKTIVVLVCMCTFLAGTALADPDGIWKDNATPPTYNFYIQTYLGDSMIVIVASGADWFWVFLDSNYMDGFNAPQYPSGSAQLAITFASDDSATASLTLPGDLPHTYAISRFAQAPAGGGGGGVGGSPPTGSLTSPANGATVSGTVTIQGTASDDVGVNRVGIRIGTAGEVNATYSSGTGQFTYSWNTTALMDGPASIVVTVYDTEGMSAVIANISVTVSNGGGGGGGLQQVTLLSPANGATVADPFSLVWNAVAGAISYWIQVSADSTFTSLFLNKTVTGTSQPVSPGGYGGPFYWRVLANFSGGSGPWSAVWNFSYGGGGGGGGGGACVLDATLSYPPNDSIVDFDFSVGWICVIDAIGYRFQICGDAACTLVYLDQSVGNFTSLWVGVDFPGRYYWRVAPLFSGGFMGIWSATWSVIVPAG